MKPIDVAKSYFELSNESNFDEISKLLTDTTTYSSQNTGLYLGADDIVEMQKGFHAKFKSLRWDVNKVDEVKPGIVLFDYDFTATHSNGQEVHSSGLEYVLVKDGKIQHVEIRKK